MTAAVEALLPLHELDQEILLKRQAAAEARRAVKEAQAELGKAEMLLDLAKGKTKDARAREGLKEVDLKDVEAQILSWTVKLNGTKDNKEYQGILHQIVQLKERKGALEEEILAMMSAGDGVQRESADEERHLAEARTRYEAIRAEKESFAADRDREAAALEGRRAALAAQVVPDVLAYYERIRSKRDGRGLAAAADGVCQGCYMGLTPNQVNQLGIGRDLVKCQSCGRLLHLAPASAPAPSSTGPGEA